MDSQKRKRPDMDEYFMNIAIAVRKRANCKGSRVGAVLVRDRRIISTGYNGTPVNVPNCEDGGCDRCANREKYGAGTGYDVCICVHAEQNALLSAARFGVSVEDAVIYSTMRPCFGCTKELLQAGVKAVYFLHDWQHPEPEMQSQYDILQARFPEGVKQIKVDDPDSDWALCKSSKVPHKG